MSKVKHGHAFTLKKTPTYRSWQDMKRRCFVRNRKEYAQYGARGITVCDRWLDFSNFLTDMGERPPGTSLDRYPNQDGNYEPNNCRWATQLEQVHNSRVVKMLTFRGKTLCIRDWEKSLDLSAGALWHRLKAGWPVEKALTTKRLVP